MGRIGGAVAIVLVASFALVGCTKRCPDGSPADDGKCTPGTRSESLVAPPAEEPGYLVIVCTPSCDEITEEGRSLGPTPLLKVPVDAPSILDLPTDRVAESDLQDVLWRDPSGIDILLAPPRVEMAEMVTGRDLDKILSLLRRVYGSIVIDMSSALNDINLSFLDLSDTSLAMGGEQGLLGLAFHPGYPVNGRFFVYLTNAVGNIEVREYARADADHANPVSATPVLSFTADEIWGA